eukprot:gnl/MRDRNA2_/MRDRNA2_130080_c0_seq1.p1 gnl/MRDRNA2_/MRDRNA2_130080_c0~~gnl/MRDRNA2_/MRDRNA2_130080_c0_seq1.p1  ORF type:complete len:462 (+),score=73.53 gnl/MRDRNA2_/MRDRNA2_130080_c0_seq1:85-1470(+)
MLNLSTCICILAAANLTIVEGKRFQTVLAASKKSQAPVLSPDGIHQEYKPPNRFDEEPYTVTINSLKVCQENSQEWCYNVSPAPDDQTTIFFQQFQGYDFLPNGDTDTKDCVMRAANNFAGRIVYDASTYSKWVDTLFANRAFMVDVIDAFLVEKNLLGDFALISFPEHTIWEQAKADLLSDQTKQEFFDMFWLSDFVPNKQYEMQGILMLFASFPLTADGDLKFVPVNAYQADLMGTVNHAENAGCVLPTSRRIYIGDTQRGHAYALRKCPNTGDWHKLDSMAWRQVSAVSSGHFRTTAANAQPQANLEAYFNEEAYKVLKLVEQAEGLTQTQWKALKDQGLGGAALWAAIRTTSGMPAEITCTPELYVPTPQAPVVELAANNQGWPSLGDDSNTVSLADWVEEDESEDWENDGQQYTEWDGEGEGWEGAEEWDGEGEGGQSWNYTEGWDEVQSGDSQQW